MLKDSTKEVVSQYAKSLSYWRIWYFWGKQDVKGRYRRSLFGGAWVVIHMLIWSISAALIYGQLFNQDVTYFMPYVLVGFTVWGLLSNTLSEGGNAFLSAEGYIKQIPFPYGIYIFRNATSHFLNFVALIPVLIVVYLVMGKSFKLEMLWFLPGLFLVFLVCLLHIIIVAHMTLFIRDLPHALASIMQPLFFITPLIYKASDIPEKWQWVFEWNIFYYLVEVIRRPLVDYQAVPNDYYLILGLYCLFLTLLGLFIVKRTQPVISYKL